MMRPLIAGTALLFTLPLAVADDAPAVSTDAVYACASLAEDTERLACYDAAVGRLKAAEEAGEITTVSRAEVEEVQKDAFGFSLPSLPKLVLPKFGGDTDKDGALDSLTLAVSSVKRTSQQGLQIHLENGQVWQQTDGTRIQYSRRAGVKEATIKRSAFGSYKIKLDGGVAFRAKRLK